MNYPLDIVARLRLAACRFTGNAEPLETKAADEIERLRDRVARLVDAAVAAASVNVAPRVHISQPFSPLTLAEHATMNAGIAKALAAMTPPEKTFDDKLKERTASLAKSVKRTLTAVKGLDSSNLVFKHQAECDLALALREDFANAGFDAVAIERVYAKGGDVYAVVDVPTGASYSRYCQAAQALTGYQLRCVYC